VTVCAAADFVPLTQLRFTEGTVDPQQAYCVRFKMHEPYTEKKYQEYLRFAEDARRIALTLPNGDVRQSFEKLADGWQLLAEQTLQVEKSEKTK
jgi:hypothetical protein